MCVYNTSALLCVFLYTYGVYIFVFISVASGNTAFAVDVRKKAIGPQLCLKFIIAKKEVLTDCYSKTSSRRNRLVIASQPVSYEGELLSSGKKRNWDWFLRITAQIQR
jgi:hypothetical protein